MTTRFPVQHDLIGDWAIIQGADWTWSMRLLVDAQPAPPFVQSTPYVVGNYLVPQSGAETGYTYLVVTAGTSAAANPTWPTVNGGRVTSGGATFMAIGSTRLLDPSTFFGRMTIRTAFGGTSTAFASDATGRIFTTYDPPERGNLTVYALGQQVVPTTPNGWIYECVAAGTSAAAAPVWPTTLGAVVTDATVTWRNVKTDATLTNMRIMLPASYTAGLVNWGLGLYDVEIETSLGVVTRIFEGNATLSQELST